MGKVSHVFIWLLLMAVFSVPVTALAQVCTGIVQQALEATHARCDELGTNQACYGHARLEAQPQAGLPEFTFQAPGDIINVTALRSLRLSALDEQTGIWGVARMAVQPSAPDVDPGEQVTFLLFGDVEIQNLIPQPSATAASVLSQLNVNVRREPSLEAFVTRTLVSGEGVVARGRTEDNRWLYIQTSDGEYGWVSAPAMQIEGGIAAVNAIEPWTTNFGPMQAIRLETGEDGVLCDDMPESGVLIQTPDGVAEVSLWINEVKVRLGSTAYIRAGRNREMRITMLEGQAQVEAQGETVTAPAGTELTIQLDQNLAPVAPPSVPQQIQAPVNNLPVQDLERPVPTLLPTVVLPTPTLIPTLTETPTALPTLTPTDTPTITPTNSPLPTNTDTPTPSLTPSDTPLPPPDTPTPTTAAFIPPTATLLEPSPDPPTQVISYQPAMQGRQLSRTPPGRGRRGNSGGENRNGRGSAHEGTGE